MCVEVSDELGFHRVGGTTLEALDNTIEFISENFVCWRHLMSYTLLVSGSLQLKRSAGCIPCDLLALSSLWLFWLSESKIADFRRIRLTC